MNKKLMLLGFCMMGAFGTVQADEPESQPADTAVVAQETTTASTTVKTTKTVTDDKEDCGCKR